MYICKNRYKMTFEEWINAVISSGQLCSSYTDKVASAKSKLQIMRIVLDANGVNYLQEMQEKGMGLPYETILREFKNYINDNYIAEYRNERGGGYTSTIYCCYSDGNRIDVVTTLATFLGCSNVELHIAENNFAHIYLDKNCDVSIHCPISARCIVDYWDGAIVRCSDKNVILVKH